MWPGVENVLWKYVVMKNENRLVWCHLVTVVSWQYLEMLCEVYHCVVWNHYKIWKLSRTGIRQAIMLWQITQNAYGLWKNQSNPAGWKKSKNGKKNVGPCWQNAYESLANEKCVGKILGATLSPRQILGELVKTNLEYWGVQKLWYFDHLSTSLWSLNARHSQNEFENYYLW